MQMRSATQVQEVVEAVLELEASVRRAVLSEQWQQPNSNTDGVQHNQGSATDPITSAADPGAPQNAWHSTAQSVAVSRQSFSPSHRGSSGSISRWHTGIGGLLAVAK